MPGIMDRTLQLMNELKTTRLFSEEVEGMDSTDRQAAQAELLPEFEKAVDLSALQRFNEKARQWIDKHPRP